ncbi:MAG: BACON domain-containing carbohydrate-binding protein [Dysgonamonadaceae bacterium]|nr:BACON domain-containing carbohydrate-binding protein [Dysgonamonadaceae bacterium]
MKTKTTLKQKVAKTIFYALLLVFSTTVINSCSSSPEDDIGKTDPPKETPTLSVSPKQIENVATSGGNTKITITTNQSSWSAASDEGWCKITDKTEKGFTIVVDANSTTSERNATVTVSAGKATPVKITVTQQGSAPALSVSPKQIENVADTGGNTEITVTTNQSEWSATSDEDWCNIADKTEKEFTIVVDANNTTSERNATVTVSAGKATPVKITVTQQGAALALSVSPTEVLDVADTGSTTKITVSTNQSSWNATSDADWCSVTDKTENSFVVFVAPNQSLSPRNGVITVSAGEAAPVKIAVTQKGETPVLTVPSTKTIELPPFRNHYAITVTTNLSEYSATSDATWCTITDKAGRMFYISAEPNTSVSPRNATVTLSAEQVAPVKISVTQQGEAPVLSLLPETKTILFSSSAENEKHTYNVTTNVSTWEVNMTPTDATWCKLTKDVANNSFSISADANESKTARGPVVVTVSAGSATPIEVTVNQKAQAYQNNEDFDYGEGSEWD